jgi:recombination associated protein RdgC
MGILSNSASICQFTVVGNLPGTDLFPWMSDRLAKNGFVPIDQGTAELSVGWVHLDDYRENTFAYPAAFWRDHYVALTLRQDRRTIPAALLRAHQKIAESDFLTANPGYSRVPKQKREELRDAVRNFLLAKTLPVPTTFDAIWDMDKNLLTLATLSVKAVDQFENHFKKTFDGFRLVAIHPYSRAEAVVPGELASALTQANRSTTDAVLDLMKSNRWLGWDFLRWVMYNTMNEASEYRITQAGPADAGDPFIAYLNDRMVLCSTGEDGAQKITVTGPQDRFGEVRTALQSGKQITEATIHFEKGEQLWKMNLKGEMFHFASFKAPRVTVERDAGVDEASEREAVFYERMNLLEVGQQMFDSLYAAFLGVRLGDGWQQEMRKIDIWLNPD